MGKVLLEPRTQVDDNYYIRDNIPPKQDKAEPPPIGQLKVNSWVVC
jgi:hypothetical protein